MIYSPKFSNTDSSSVSVLHLTTSDINGGAAKASHRIHRSLLDLGINSRMLAMHVSSSESEILQARSCLLSTVSKVRPHIGYSILRFQHTDNQDLHSVSILPSGLIQKINNSPFDIVNLHWVQGEYLSIEDIGRITKPLAWTLHDMWAFCGAEHYTKDLRFIDGYTKYNRSCGESGIDINMWAWRRKVKSWQRQIHIVCPSKWLANAANSSKLMSGWPIYQIPYPIDDQVYYQSNSLLAKERLRIRNNQTVILYGALGINKDRRKGFDLFAQALCRLHNILGCTKEIVVVVFGDNISNMNISLPFPVRCLGYIANERYLKDIYCSADAVVVPSREDNLPQIALEAQMCGTPVVAFEIGGLSDIILHLNTGYLAKPFDTDELAHGINWAIGHTNINIRINSGRLAKARYSPSVVAKRYNALYKNILYKNSQSATEI